MKRSLNFRDIGGSITEDGWYVKKGKIFRSGSLEKISMNDLNFIRSLNLRTIVDLRSPFERKKHPSPNLQIYTINLPLSFDETTRERVKPYILKKNSEKEILEICNSVYIDMVDAFRPHLKKLFETLLNRDNYPVLIHCKAGKDRTGMACAIIQDSLGLGINGIINDYLKTNDELLPQINRMVTFAKIFTLNILPAQNLRTAFTAQERYIRSAFEKIHHEYGGIAQYLQNCGIDYEQIKKFKEILLEKPGIINTN